MYLAITLGKLNLAALKLSPVGGVRNWMGDPRQILSWRSIFVLSLLLLVFCILCGVIIMNSKLDFRLKKDKVSRVIKKPNRNVRSRNVTWHIHKQTICLRSETRWKLLLYLDFRSFFGKYWPKLLQCSTIFAFAAPWHLQEKLLVICSWFTE